MLPVTVKLRKPTYDVQPTRRDRTMQAGQGKCGSRLQAPHTPLFPSREREQEMRPRTQCLPYSEELGGKARLGTAIMVLKAGYLISCRRRDNPPKG